MVDIDRLIEAWKIFRDSNPYEICNGREFRAIREPEYCMGQMIEDTITLLRDQEAKPVYYETNSMTGLPISHCPSCGEVIRQYAYGDIRKTYYCPYCGQEVKWE